MRRIVTLSLLAGLAPLLFGACTGKDNGGTPAAATTTQPAVPGQVVVANVAFNPSSITVAHGTPVTWRFDDNGVPHSVTSDVGSPVAFDSGQQTSGSFAFTFNSPGRYAYHCVVHARMHGTVTVT